MPEYGHQIEFRYFLYPDAAEARGDHYVDEVSFVVESDHYGSGD
jgi:hypothetical protein